MLTKEEKEILFELICNEQVKYLVANDKYDSDKYIKLEELKAKIRDM